MSELICLFPECETHEHARGLCKLHYCSARRLLTRGEATEEDLISRGLMLEKRRPGKAQDARLDILALGSTVTGKGIDDG